GKYMKYFGIGMGCSSSFDFVGWAKARGRSLTTRKNAHARRAHHHVPVLIAASIDGHAAWRLCPPYESASLHHHRSHAGAWPTGLAMRPSGRLSALIRLTSSSLSEKSNTAMFSAIRAGFDERGIGATIPFWTSQRSAT